MASSIVVGRWTSNRRSVPTELLGRVREELREDLVALLADRGGAERRDAAGDLVAAGHAERCAAPFGNDREVDRRGDARGDLAVLARGGHAQTSVLRIDINVEVGPHRERAQPILEERRVTARRID